jgi:hypothetical protein
MADYQVKVRKDGELHEVVVEAGSWPLAGVRAVKEVGGGVVVDVAPLGETPDIIEL